MDRVQSLSLSLPFGDCVAVKVFDVMQVRRLEAQGLPSKQAEVITSVITEVLNDSLENVAQSFVSKGDMQKVIAFNVVLIGGRW